MPSLDVLLTCASLPQSIYLKSRSCSTAYPPVGPHDSAQIAARSRETGQASLSHAGFESLSPSGRGETSPQHLFAEPWEQALGAPP